MFYVFGLCSLRAKIFYVVFWKIKIFTKLTNPGFGPKSGPDRAGFRSRIWLKMDFDFFTAVYWINLHKHLINFGQKSKNPFSIRFWTEIRPCQGRTSVQNHFQNWFLIFLPKFCILYPIFQSFLRWLFFEVYEKAILDRNPARARAGFRSKTGLKKGFQAENSKIVPNFTFYSIHTPCL